MPSTPAIDDRDAPRFRPDGSAAVRRYRVRMVDMGHTHYNEVANDGAALSAVVITSPADWRRQPDDRAPRLPELPVRAKIWAASRIAQARARSAGRDVPSQRIAGSTVWDGTRDNARSWAAHGALGSRLGSNKHGRTW